MKLNSVHVHSLAINATNISIETIDGDDHYVIRGVVPIVDDVVMNGGLYPAAEINKSYQTLEGKPMPMGHPKIGADYVSADNPRAVNQFHVGAWQENVRKDGERVVMDMKVNKRYAESTDKGKCLIERLDAMVNGDDVEPIHVSTGLLLQREANTGKSKGKKHTWIARNMSFDHTAILLDEPGAATPDDGVGIFVNADGDKFDIEQVNLADSSDLTKDGLLNKAKFYFTNASNFSFDDIHSALRAKLRQKYIGDEWPYPESVWPDKFIYYLTGKTYQQKYLIDDDGVAEFVGEPVEVVRKPTEYEIKTNGEDPMKNIIINALKEAGKPTEGKTDAELLDAYNQLKQPAEPTFNSDALTAAINAAVLPLKDEIGGLKVQLNASAESEIKTKRDVVKLAMNMSDEEVADLAGKALDKLYANCQSSQGLNTSFQMNANSDQWKGYDMNAGFEETK